MCQKVQRLSAASGSSKESCDLMVHKKYKARLVGKGFFQKDSIDFFDIYAPLCRITTIRVLIGLIAIKRFIIYQMGMTTAFLNKNLTKEIYVERSE